MTRISKDLVNSVTLTKDVLKQIGPVSNDVQPLEVARAVIAVVSEQSKGSHTESRGGVNRLTSYLEPV